jgi:raffinose/stachyose/melibiose transport system permease protein
MTKPRQLDGYPLVRYAVLVAVAGVVLVPLLATALGGFKSLGELRTNPFGLPAQWDFSHYASILGGRAYWQMMGNSLVIATLTVVLTLALSSMAAFAFMQLRFIGQGFLFNYLLLGLMFPAATAILPLFVRIRDLGLLDSYWGVVLPQVAYGLTMSVLLFRNAFKNLPHELFAAARLDGCSYAGFFWRIVLPMSKPILATVAVIVFVQSWNGYLLPLMVLNRDSLYPWPLGIMAYQGQYSTDWHLVLAYITLTILPAVVLFFAAQKHIVAGMTTGAVKG